MLDIVNQLQMSDKSQYRGLLIYPTRSVLNERMWGKGKKTKTSRNKSLKV